MTKEKNMDQSTEPKPSIQHQLAEVAEHQSPGAGQLVRDAFSKAITDGTLSQLLAILWSFAGPLLTEMLKKFIIGQPVALPK